ncbi:MAG TPA: hypothetical protein VH640_17335 [Bryobacteraceae bacterium]
MNPKWLRRAPPVFFCSERVGRISPGIGSVAGIWNTGLPPGRMAALIFPTGFPQIRTASAGYR